MKKIPSVLIVLLIILVIMVIDYLINKKIELRFYLVQIIIWTLYSFLQQKKNKDS